MCEEMVKFRKLLDEKNIEWYDVSNETEFFTIHRTHFYYKGNNVSVINGHGSYGGCSFYEGKNLGLLEVMIGNNDPEGYLTAEEAIKYIFD